VALSISSAIAWDGFLDLVAQVETENLAPEECKDGYTVLTRETNDGVEFMGEDEIIIWPHYPGRIFPYESTAEGHHGPAFLLSCQYILCS
jgi:hypothetical protein